MSAFQPYDDEHDGKRNPYAPGGELAETLSSIRQSRGSARKPARGEQSTASGGGGGTTENPMMVMFDGSGELSPTETTASAEKNFLRHATSFFEDYDEQGYNRTGTPRAAPNTVSRHFEGAGAGNGTHRNRTRSTITGEEMNQRKSISTIRAQG